MKTKGFLFFLFIMILLIAELDAQNTIGTISISDNVQEGYTLFAPNSSETTYLIDNCGNVVNTWLSEYDPGLSVYLTPEGNLVRTRRAPNTTFFAGGVGGGIQIFNWEGELTWDYVLSTETNILHHDISLLPNGNILAIAFERISQGEALGLGRRLELVPQDGLWTDVIIEIKPLPNNQHEIVWKWRAIDHVVQNENSNLPNFGEIVDHPERLDINFNNGNLASSALIDWMHCNAIDYNEELDQILLNSRNYNEFYIIDHSTTTKEAAGSEGGQYGKGGDLLYRWGNPSAYNAGLQNDRKLFGQHDANWIDTGLKDAGKIFVFNNGLNRPSGLQSAVELIDPPINADGSYLRDGIAYGPDEPEWSYGLGPEDEDITSARISGVGRLPNGNTMITVGSKGRIIELNENEKIVWEYILPLIGSTPNTQGNSPTSNSVFRSYKYSLDYPPFINNNINIGVPIELQPNNNFCLLLPVEQVSVLEQSFELIGNIIESELRIRSNQELTIEVIDVNGAIHKTFDLSVGDQFLQVDNLPAGIYFIRQLNPQKAIFTNQKFIKTN